MRIRVRRRHYRQRTARRNGSQATRTRKRAKNGGRGEKNALLPRNKTGGGLADGLQRNTFGQPPAAHRRHRRRDRAGHQKGFPARDHGAADFHHRKRPARGVHRGRKDQHEPDTPAAENARTAVHHAGSGAREQDGGGGGVPCGHRRRKDREGDRGAHFRHRHRRRARFVIHRKISRQKTLLAVQAGGHDGKAGYFVCKDARRARGGAGGRLAHRADAALHAGGGLSEFAGLFRIPLPRDHQPYTAAGRGGDIAVSARLLCGGGTVPPATFALRTFDDHFGQRAGSAPLAQPGTLFPFGGAGSTHRGERAHAQVRGAGAVGDRRAGAGRYRRESGHRVFPRHHHRGAFGHFRLHGARPHGNDFGDTFSVCGGGGQHRHLRDTPVHGAAFLLSGIFR